MIWPRRRDSKAAGPAVRRGRRGDADAIAALSTAFRAELEEQTTGLTATAYLRDGFGRKREFDVLIAEVDGMPVGYTLFFESYEPTYCERGLYLADLYVRPEHRKAGIGRTLVACVAAESRRRKRTFVWWLALATNPEAQAFYTHLGVVTVPVMANAAFGETFEKLAAQAPRYRR